MIPGDEPSAANIRHISNTWQLGEFSLLAWAPEQQPAPRLGKFQECCKSPAVFSESGTLLKKTGGKYTDANWGNE